MKKKISKIFIVMLLLSCSLIFLSACDLDSNESNNSIVIYVDFNTNGGSVVESIKTSDYKVAKMPINPTKEHFVFQGWYADNRTYLIPFSVNVLQNYPLQNNNPERRITVYAKWKLEQFLILLDSDINGVTEKTYNYETVISNLQSPTIDGYEFFGWYQDELFTDAVVFPYTVTKNDVFYAKVEKEKYYIKQTNNRTKEIIDEKWCYYGDSLTLNYGDLIGYYKTNWRILNKGVTIDSNLTSYIVPDLGDNNEIISIETSFFPNIYTFTFNLNKETNTTPIIRNTRFNDRIVISTPTINSPTMTFAGWYDSASGGNLISIDSSFLVNMVYENNAEKTFFAQWRKKVYNFEYYYSLSLSGQPLSTLKYEIGTTINLPLIEETGRGQYNCYWNIYSIGSSIIDLQKVKLGNPGEEIVISDYGADASIVRVYITGERERYSLSVNGGGTICSMGSVITLNIPEIEEGYEFKGYYSQPDGQGTYLGYDSYTVPDLGDNGAALGFYAYFENIQE